MADRSRAWVFFLAAAAAALLGCIETTPLAGGGSDVGNGSALTGRVSFPGGRSAAGVQVMLRRADYLSGAPADSVPGGLVRGGETVTDALGYFTFRKVDSGSYFVQARFGAAWAGLAQGQALKDKPLALPTAVMRAPGRITGKVLGRDGLPVPALIRVYGLEATTRNDSVTGAFALEGLPPGVFTLRVETARPLLGPAVLNGLKVEAGAALAAGDIRLPDGPKLVFQQTPTGLRIEGMDAANPIVLENDVWGESPDDFYLWAKASLGRAALRANIVTYDLAGVPQPFDLLMNNCLARVAEARASGLTNVLDPLAGAGRPLTARPGAYPLPLASAGTDAIVAEARKATVEKPLLVLAGGPLTTVASAWLTDSSIAQRMIVFANYGNGENATDSLAMELVARKCRLVVWGRGYNWPLADSLPGLNRLPNNRIGDGIRRYFREDQPLGFFGDVAHTAQLFSGKVWKQAAKFNVVSQPLNAAPAPGSLFDFLDIPKDGNDWQVAADEILGTLADPAVYHPMPVPGKVEAEGYHAQKGLVVQQRSASDPVAADSLEAGDWVELRVEAKYAGAFGLTLRILCGADGNLALEAQDGTPLATVNAAAGAAWQDKTASVALPAGVQVLRLRGLSGSFAVDALTFSP